MRKAYIILVLLVALSFLIEGKYASYSPFPIHGTWRNNDHTLVIPAAYAITNDGYFQNDPVVLAYLNVFPRALPSLLAFGYNTTKNMFVSYLLELFVLKTIFVFSVFFLSQHLFKNERLAILSTFAVSFSHFMGPEDIGVSEVLGKSIAFAFMPLIFYASLKYDKFAESYAGAGILTYFHVMSSIPIALALSFVLISKKQIKRSLIGLAIFFILSFPLLIDLTARTPVNIETFKETTPYANIQNYAPSVLKYLPIIFAGIWSAKKYDKKMAGVISVFFAYSLLSIIGLVFEQLLPIAFYRTARYGIFFSYIYVVAFLFDIKNIQFPLKVLIVSLIIFPFSSIHYSNLVPNAIALGETPASAESHDLLLVGSWLDSNTAKNETILAPPEWPEIRVWSKRALVATENDLFVGSVNPNMEVEIRDRYYSLKGAFENPTTETMINLGNMYNARYIVVYNKYIDLPLRFSSGAFRIYDISNSREFVS